MMSKEWDKERDAMSEAWYLPESKQEPVAVVGSVFSLLWINRGHYGVSVGDFLYTAPPKREPLSDEEHMKLWDETDGSKGLFHKIHEYGVLIEKAHGI
jgi:hypothetical protein